jgi:hypothetical protein
VTLAALYCQLPHRDKRPGRFRAVIISLIRFQRRPNQAIRNLGAPVPGIIPRRQPFTDRHFPSSMSAGPATVICRGPPEVADWSRFPCYHLIASELDHLRLRGLLTWRSARLCAVLRMLLVVILIAE